MISRLPTPKELVAKLDETIIGQERAKIALSVAVYNHYSLLAEQDIDIGSMCKSNMMFMGPTGCGKTLLLQSMAKLLDIPFVMVDSTGYTPASVRGPELEEIIKYLFREAGEDVDATEHGIVFLDEFDKLAAPKSVGNSQEIMIAIQQGYLKLLEGLEINIGRGWRRSSSFDLVSSRSKQPERNKIDTSRILFICGGAFTGLDQIVSRRLKGSCNEPDEELDTMARSLYSYSKKKQKHKNVSVVGFSGALDCSAPEKENDDIDLWSKVSTEDLVEYGLIPEILGRIPFRVSLNGLDEEALVQVLTKPKNAVLKQFRQKFLRAGSDLIFTPDAIKAVASEALKNKTGARGLATILENLLLMAQYEVLSGGHEDENVVVDGGAAAGKYQPKFVKKPDGLLKVE